MAKLSLKTFLAVRCLGAAALGMLLKTMLDEAGVENRLVYPGGPEAPWPSATAFLIDKLKS